MWPFLLACAKPPEKPPMVTASEQALRACSTEEIVAYRNQLATNVSAPSRAALESRYERAVATWAVCQTLRKQKGWSIPPVVDGPARALIHATETKAGTPERIQALAAAKDALPEAVGLLALEDLRMLVEAAAAQPARLPELTAYICAPLPPEGDSLCGGTGKLGLAGLETLRALAFPSVNPQNALTIAFREPVHEAWDAIAQHEIPMAQTAPLPIAALPVGPGAPLVPPIGPPYVVIGPPGGLWLAGPVLLVTPESMSISVAQPKENGWPDAVPDGPYLWIDKNVTVEQLATLVEGHHWARPVIVGTDGQGNLLALQAPLPERVAIAPTDPGVIVLGNAASVQDLVALAKPDARVVLVGEPAR